MTDFATITEHLQVVVGGTWAHPENAKKAAEIGAKMPSGDWQDGCSYTAQPLTPLTSGEIQWLNTQCPAATGRGASRNYR